MFIVRCRYYQYDRPEEPEQGVGYLTREGWCIRERAEAAIFEVEAEAWDFARASGAGKLPEEVWVEAA